MALGQGTVNGIAGGVSDIFGGYNTQDALDLKAYGNRMEAANYDLAATYAHQNEQFTKVSTAVKQTQLERNIYQTIGGQQADVASAGFSSSGSALDLMRDSAAQGALTTAVAGAQGQIQELGYAEQAKSYENMAVAARYAADVQEQMGDNAVMQGLITGGIKLLGGIATLAP